MLHGEWLNCAKNISPGLLTGATSVLILYPEAPKLPEIREECYDPDYRRRLGSQAQQDAELERKIWIIL